MRIGMQSVNVRFVWLAMAGSPIGCVPATGTDRDDLATSEPAVTAAGPLVSVQSGRCLDVAGAQTAPGQVCRYTHAMGEPISNFVSPTRVSCGSWAKRVV